MKYVYSNGFFRFRWRNSFLPKRVEGCRCYADKQEVVLTPNQQLGEQVPAEDLEKKYLEDVVGASSDYDPED